MDKSTTSYASIKVFTHLTFYGNKLKMCICIFHMNKILIETGTLLSLALKCQHFLDIKCRFTSGVFFRAYAIPS